MERFMWQSYPQHVQNTLFNEELLKPHRKKTLEERLAQGYAFKAKGDELFERKKWTRAVKEYECAYGLFKYCEKHGQKITLQDDAQTARQQRRDNPDLDNRFTRFWLQVDELLCSCLVLVAACHLQASKSSTAHEAAVATTTEALEIRPGHPPALYRRSLAYEKQANFSMAVADARESLRCARRITSADDDDRVLVRLERHFNRMVHVRREHSLWWGFVGQVSDAGAAVLQTPQRVAALSRPQQLLLVLVLAALCLVGTHSGLLDGPAQSAHAVASSDPDELGELAEAVADGTEAAEGLENADREAWLPSWVRFGFASRATAATEGDDEDEW